MNWSCEKLRKWTGDALAAFARPRMLPCAVKVLGISIIACFHISTIPQCAAQAAPVPRLAFQTYAVRDLCEKDFVGTLKASKALRELGRGAEAVPRIAELKAAIKELEMPQPVIINAYAKFAGDNSAMERAAKAREKAGELRKLLKELEE